MFKVKPQAGPATEQDEQKAYEYALKLLTGREYSRRELFQKLQQRYVREVALKTLQRCIRANLQSDERYAEMLLRHMVYQGYGPLKYVQSCRRQGLSAQIYQPWLGKTDWLQLALEVLGKKASRYEASETDRAFDYQQRQKLMAMLYRRGFPTALITEAMEQFARKV